MRDGDVVENDTAQQMLKMPWMTVKTGQDGAA